MPGWSLPLITFGWIIVTVLYRPAIIPQQPWASRRLAPGVLPGLILLAVWAASWLFDWARRNDFGPVAYSVVPLCAAALVMPAAMTTFGLGIRDGGPLGVRLVADGWAVKATEAGEIGAVDRMCAALPRNSSVVMMDGTVSGRFTEVIRGMCGYPTAVLPNPARASVQLVVQRIARAGRKPVLLATDRAALSPYGNGTKEVMLLHTHQEVGVKMHPPESINPLDFEVWMLEPAP